MEPKASYWKFVAGFAGIILVALSAYFIWNKFFKYDINAVYKKAEADYVAAMTADTYGGKTPKETLDLFVKALRAGDVELASKYFLLDENASREKWGKLLLENKNKGLLSNMAEDFSTATFYKTPTENAEQFVIYNKDKTDSLIINLVLNKYSKVWKIESL